MALSPILQSVLTAQNHHGITSFSHLGHREAIKNFTEEESKNTNTITDKIYMAINMKSNMSICFLKNSFTLWSSDFIVYQQFHICSPWLITAGLRFVWAHIAARILINISLQSLQSLFQSWNLLVKIDLSFTYTRKKDRVPHPCTPQLHQASPRITVHTAGVQNRRKHHFWF